MTLAVLPVGEAAVLWRAIDFTPDPDQLATVGGLVDADVVGPGRLVAVDDGRFSVELDDGDYLVCLLDGTGPYALRGCADATVVGPAAWHISAGEGGLSVRRDD